MDLCDLRVAEPEALVEEGYLPTSEAESASDLPDVLPLPGHDPASVPPECAPTMDSGPVGPYPSLKTSAGSVRPMRAAGTKEATAAKSPRKPARRTRVTGSKGWTP